MEIAKLHAKPVTKFWLQFQVKIRYKLSFDFTFLKSYSSVIFQGIYCNFYFLNNKQNKKKILCTKGQEISE